LGDYIQYRKGFTFTITERSSVVIGDATGEAYYQLSPSEAPDSTIITGYMLYKTLEAGTYRILTDDNGASSFNGEPLTTHMNVYIANDSYKSYTELPYSQPIDTAVSGQIQDTLFLFQRSVHITYSTADPYYINVQEGNAYRITCTFNSTDKYAGGIYILQALTGDDQTDIFVSIFVDNEKQTNSTVYTAEATGTIKILPFSFASGIPYRISVEQIEDIYTIPEALDAATTITNIPYNATGVMGDGLLINCEDASVIGFMPYELYYGYPFKVHLAKNDTLAITMNVDLFSMMEAGEVFIFEKSNDGYIKVGKNGADEEDVPTIVYTAQEEMDLYILAALSGVFSVNLLPMFLQILGIDLPIDAADLPYELTITHDVPLALENINATANIKITNPVKDFATIQESAGKNIEVYDNLGKCILKQKIASDNEQIATNSWAKGIYFVKLTKDGMNLGTAKLIKI
jgi:hypothetical protein